ncbi:hypothetical protein CYG49_02265 [Candidatus Saccharibacteria bacterium]|nr:MAG: hypothetical protein CYG49_02265 [Candidatus Saccharibacteria bacterium]
MATYFIDQKITVLVNQYFIYAGNSAGEKGDLVAFVQQKRFSFKEKITFYKDESKNEEFFTVQARQVVDLGAVYDIKDADQKQLGIVKKAFKSSLLRSTWHLLDEDEKTPRLIVQETSLPLAIVRRVWQFVPVISDIPFLLKYHFSFMKAGSEAEIASYQKVELFRDRYKLSLTQEAEEAADWRVFVAIGVMLDALQGR